MKQVDVFECGGRILKALKTGALVTTKAGDRVNSMTISWGTLGIEFSTPIFVVYVRGSRFTSTLLEKNPEFTINLPVDGNCREILKVCGTKSGRDMDKIRELGLTLTPPQVISVPGIRELPLTLECKVLYSQQQEPACVRDPKVFTHYPPETEDIHGDYHTAYYGEIVAAYIAE